jgi:putative ABC transport system substrate-binding protein
LLPRVTKAQPSRPIPTVGVLHGGSPALYAKRIEAFRKGLSDAGFAEGKDVAIDYRWADGNYALLPGMARDLVQRRVAVIFAGGGVASAPVAKAATDTIPIVFAIGSDPVADGLVKSLARPDGNATGVSFLTHSLSPKRMGFLNLIAPAATNIGIVFNPNNASTKPDMDGLRAAAQASRRVLHAFEARTADEIDQAFEVMSARSIDAIMVQSDPFFTGRLDQLTRRAAAAGKPAIFASRDFAEAGGLVSYGADVRDEYRKAGDYVARLLRGAKTADLPILQPTKFELVLNLKTAKQLGIAIPDSLQLIADDVIE